MELVSIPNEIKSVFAIRSCFQIPFSVCSSLSVRDHISQPYSTTDKYNWRLIVRQEENKPYDWVLTAHVWKRHTSDTLATQIQTAGPRCIWVIHWPSRLPITRQICLYHSLGSASSQIHTILSEGWLFATLSSTPQGTTSSRGKWVGTIVSPERIS